MANKKATVFILNCGPSMNLIYPGQEVSAYKQGVDVIIDALGEKVLANRKTDLTSVVLSGTQKTDNSLAEKTEGQYLHITSLSPLQQPTYKDLQMVSERPPTAPTDPTADIMDALILAIDMIMNKCKHLKYTKQIVLITDAAEPIDWRDAIEVQEMMNQNEISLVLLGADFDGSGLTKMEDNDPELTAIRELNQKHWAHVVTGDARHKLIGLQEAYTMALGFKVKEVMPVASYRGHLTFSEGLEWNVNMFSYTKPVRAASLKKWSTLPDTILDEPETSSSAQPVTHQVKMVRSFRIKPKEQTGAQEENVDRLDDLDLLAEAGDALPSVDESALEKAYPFGKVLVMITADEEKLLKLETTPSMLILGFYTAANVPRHFYMGPTYLLMAGKIDATKARDGMAALAQSLYEKDVVALVRFVNRVDASPKLGVLSPFFEGGVRCLLFCQVPFSEDYRPFNFSSLDKIKMKSGKVVTENHPLLPTQDMKDQMNQFVRKMDLMDVDGEEMFAPEDNFNPAVWRMNQAIMARALNDSANLPALHPRLQSQTKPPSALVDRSAALIKTMTNTFQVKKINTDKKRTRYGAGKGQEESRSAAHLQPIDAILVQKSTAAATEAGQEPAKRPKVELLSSWFDEEDLM
ncbi:SPOC domain-like protein [Hesseltinella vesiculosa]|uniref:ATP-dependent DNA helicase II subunit 2 n=1 Tax=Hesseltinella vesiculosa TaxID=101127 RepID=A0A1X2GWF7_9FUNG|nr:SPOC domain-like protein [Hesseltinella vesiculosa]